MITKYDSFLLENFRYNSRLILEDYLSASANFLDRLMFLSKDKGKVGEIAKYIYDFINAANYISPKSIKQNFFDTTDKEEMVSFLMHSKLPKDWDSDDNPSLPYELKGRNEIKVSKVIKYIIDIMKNEGEDELDDLKDKDIEAFVNAYKATKSSTDFKFKYLKGDDISKYYNQKKYLTDFGSLGSSCMADESKGTFKLYSQNDDKVRLLVYIDEKLDKISGRALVWKLKDSPCEATHFMDRVYVNRDSDAIKFRQYAEENGLLYKSVMNSHIESNVDFKYKGTNVSGIITVKLDGNARNYPFVDTLCFLNKGKTQLSNVPTEDCFMLHSVSGDCEHCDECNGKGWICDDAQCQYNDGEIDCDNCNGTGDSNGKKCLDCKGKGFIKCDHVDKEICSDCGEGLIKLKGSK